MAVAPPTSCRTQAARGCAREADGVRCEQAPARGGGARCGEAAAERDRLAAEAAQERDRAAAAAADRLAAVQAEVDDLRRQRDQARQSLRGLTDRIGEALQAVAAADRARRRARRPNVAVEGMVDAPTTVPRDWCDARPPFP